MPLMWFIIFLVFSSPKIADGKNIVSMCWLFIFRTDFLKILRNSTVSDRPSFASSCRACVSMIMIFGFFSARLFVGWYLYFDKSAF